MPGTFLCSFFCYYFVFCFLILFTILWPCPLLDFSFIFTHGFLVAWLTMNTFNIFFHKFLERTHKGKIQEPYESIHVKLLWEKIFQNSALYEGVASRLWKKFLSFSHAAVFYSFERSNTYLGIQLLCLIRSSASPWL